MKWFSENNVRAYIDGLMSTNELLSRGCDARDTITWDDPVAAARALRDKLAPLPDSSAFHEDFGLRATENRELILWALGAAK